ncbi:CDP-alcohol phosphatidyltransferase family protein [Allosalinactinospora lopnorensis]|uniref:CDP-alcohol phosphatidyltransferase family protein n=1 Tax=Allosalinactinospora lopnorensis TaxID=1352348 RepID=UPI000623E7BF|nr:CDP-alcohol phosphatidyltransferase family protein [Allosalinactinospora lopnorensis]
MSVFTLQDVREHTYKARDSWWTVYLVDPLAARLVLVTANRTSITPNHLTLAALGLGLGAALCFAMASWPWLVAGALLFHLSFVLDCMDGKVARLKSNGSVFGSWLDYVFDRLRVLVCAVALMGGQYAASGQQVFIWFALGIVFTDMFRYLNAPQIAKVRSGMRKSLVRAIRENDLEQEACEQAALAVEAGHRFSSDLQQRDEAEDAGGDAVGAPTPRARARQVQATELQRRFNSRFPWYSRFRDMLQRHRVRPHLVSGIEFQMGTFVVAPLVGAVSVNAMLWVIALSAAAMMAFELLIVYKLWLSTREFTRVLGAVEAAAGGSAETPVPAEDTHAVAGTGGTGTA